MKKFRIILIILIILFICSIFSKIAVHGLEPAQSNHSITVGSNVIIDGLHLNNGSGIEILEQTNVTIKNTIIENPEGYGIYLWLTTEVRLLNVTIISPQLSAIYALAPYDFEVKSSQFIDIKSGIKIKGGDRMKIISNTFNSTYKNDNSEINDAIGLQSTDDVQVINNNINDFLIGIRSDASISKKSESLLIQNNKINNVDIGITVDNSIFTEISTNFVNHIAYGKINDETKIGYGIRTEDTKHLLIANNKVIDGRFASGITYYGFEGNSNVSILGNQIINFNQEFFVEDSIHNGIEIFDGPPHNVENNTIYNITGHGIMDWGISPNYSSITGGSSIENNSIDLINGVGIGVDEVKNVDINSNRISHIKFDGISIINSEIIKIINNHISEIENNGISIFGGKEIEITGNTLESIGGVAIYAQRSESITVGTNTHDGTLLTEVNQVESFGFTIFITFTCLFILSRRQTYKKI